MSVVYELRPARTDDFESLVALAVARADSGRIRVAPRYLCNPVEAWAALKPELDWVVAEADEGLTGAGQVISSETEVEGELYRAARRRGVGRRGCRADRLRAGLESQNSGDRHVAAGAGESDALPSAAPALPRRRRGRPSRRRLRAVRRGRLQTLVFEQLPFALRALNLLVRVVPRDGELRQASISRVRLPGRDDVGVALWAYACAASAQGGKTIGAQFDPRGPL